MGAPPPRWGTFLSLICAGSAALALSSTLVGALIAQTRGRGALFAGVSFPLLLPVLAAAVRGTRTQWQNLPATGELNLLIAYTAALLAVGVLLVDHLWEE
jgi:heme exporter protein B